jgi:hypothetical protein
MLGESTVDEGRVLTEVAVWAAKTDISEELTRLRTHLDQLVLLLQTGGSVGRTLDFLAQEMNREVNTIGTKADDPEISQSVIAAKSILEKLREQAQNIDADRHAGAARRAGHADRGVSASGAGKNTLCHEVRSLVPGLYYSVS